MNEKDDVFATKKGLTQLGDWKPVWDNYDHPTSEPEETFANAVEGFQSRYGLKTDGLMTPGGPTEAVLRAETLRSDLEEAGQTSLPAPLALTQPVGLGQANTNRDVSSVRTTFDRIAHPKIGLKGLAGTPPSIQTFQSKLGLKPDGILTPGGPTEAKLNQLAAPMAMQRNNSQDDPQWTNQGSTGFAAINPNDLFPPMPDIYFGEGKQIIIDPDELTPPSGKDSTPSKRPNKCNALEDRVSTLKTELDEIMQEQNKLTDFLNEKRQQYDEALAAYEEAQESAGQPGGASDLCKIIGTIRGPAGRVGSLICSSIFEGSPVLYHSEALRVAKEKMEAAHEDASQNAQKYDALLDELSEAEDALRRCQMDATTD